MPRAAFSGRWTPGATGRPRRRAAANLSRPRGATLKDRWARYDGGRREDGFGIAPLPPAYEPVPCKPLLFDLAFNHIAPAAISHRLSAAQKQAAEKRHAANARRAAEEQAAPASQDAQQAAGWFGGWFGGAQ